MQKRQLGPDGPLVSAVGVGAMSFTDFYGPTNEAASHRVLQTALELGIDHIDTSNVYGMGLSERVIGSFLAQHRGPTPFTIATKAGIRRDPETGARSFDNSAGHLAAELDASLGRLGVDTVDLFYVHRRDPRLAIEEVTETLAGFVKAGKIRSFGFSEIAPSSLRRAAAVHPVAAVQSEYSLATRAPELGLVQACRELGTALVAFSPVARGLLTDRPPTAASVAQSAFLKANPRFTEPNFSANLAYAERFRGLAGEMDTPAAALAIAWLLHRGDRVIAIPGTRSASHLRELAQGMQLKLAAADLERIERVLPVGWAHGDRYAEPQWVGPERYC
jgi:aryl-alcohol dehydrogenase-like predicted oxidoreductase